MHPPVFAPNLRDRTGGRKPAPRGLSGVVRILTRVVWRWAKTQSTARYESRRQGMKVDGRPWRTIWLEPDGWSVGVIDQTRLPHRFETRRLTNLAEAAAAISTMVIR